MAEGVPGVAAMLTASVFAALVLPPQEVAVTLTLPPVLPAVSVMLRDGVPPPVGIQPPGGVHV
jgi:hypothetical protein